MKYSWPLLMIGVGVFGLVFNTPKDPVGYYGPPSAIGIGVVLAVIIWADNRPKDWK